MGTLFPNACAPELRGRVLLKNMKTRAKVQFLNFVGTQSLCAAIVLMSGCAGRIISDGAAIEEGHDPSTTATKPLCVAGAAPTPGDSPLRRMTRFEYDNVVRDLLADDSHASAEFPPDEVALGFDNNAEARVVGALLFERYSAAAEAIAARAKTKLSKLLECDTAAVGQDVCARRFIAEFGQKAWRRPLAPADVDALMKVYSWGKTNYDFANGIEMVVATLLQSPRFLYRVESGPAAAGAVVPLDGWEMASRLSFLIWGSMPDDALFDAARAGKLGTADEIKAQATRMLSDPRAREVVRHFHAQWLELDALDTLEKDTETYPAFTPALRDLFRAETERFIDDVFWEADGKFSTLLTAPFTYANAELAKFYGLTPPSGTALVKVPLDKRRAGLLTHGSILSVQAHAAETSPIFRGKFVRVKLLCQNLPPPPDDVVIEPPAVNDSATTRERFSQHSTDPSCAGCHRLMDPIGFGFENFDGIGRWRDVENGKTVDASGEVMGTDVSGKFNGAVELSAKLAQSEAVQLCLAKQWFRFAYGRSESAEDQCAVSQVAAPLEQARSLREVVIALTQTDAFRYRRATQ